MEKKQEIIRIIKKYRDTEYLDTAADEILRLFNVVGRSEQLLPKECGCCGLIYTKELPKSCNQCGHELWQ
jgi:predicted Zn-ribbon and HTH transcriptional regulator